MNPQYLLVFDFDNTIAQTFEPSPKGIGVKEAYAKTVEDIFGEKGLVTYQKLGGLQNRAPSELVHAILKADSTGELMKNASAFFMKEYDNLLRCVPKNHDGVLEWNILNPEKTLAEILVRQKLIILTDEIGTKFTDEQIWPRSCKGFIDFWKSIAVLDNKGEFGVTTAIVSSGHEKPIKKVFEEVFELHPPNILVTEDDIRWRKYPEDLSRRVKPGQLQLAIAHKEWLEKQGLLTDGHNHVEAARKTRARIVYFGDDPNKDGKMAKGADIMFGLFKEGQPFEANDWFCTFGDWRDIVNILTRQEQKLVEGKPLTEIFLSKPSGLESLTPPFAKEVPQSYRSLKASGRV